MRPKVTAIRVAVILFAGIVACLLVAMSRHDGEPQLNGVPLSHYLDKQTYGELRTERDARESIRDFGSNAVPYLIRILEARESKFKATLRELAQKQTVIRIHFTPLFARQSQAALACAELGPMAASASPALARLANDPVLCRHALSALAMIGPENFPILTNALLTGIPAARAEAAGDLRYMTPRHAPVPVLLNALHDPEPEVRSNAAGSLAYLRCHLDLIVPALIHSLRDTNASVRVKTAQSLGWLQQDAIAALPALRTLHQEINDPADEVKLAEAIRLIESVPAATGGGG